MEVLKHECGIAMIRLLKPLNYYKEKYGTYLYGLNKLYLLMEKQHNRGQEGAGVGCVYLNSRPGEEYIFRERALGSGAIDEIFAKVKQDISRSLTQGVDALDLPFVGEVYMGHLRYSTTGKSGLSFVHPFLRRANWRSRNLMLCGNFNMTNVDEIFSDIISRGQHPRMYGDTVILLEQLGESLDKNNQSLYDQYRHEGLDGIELAQKIENHLDFKKILERPASMWDGGYVICGATGSGDIFILRDPHGIRPAFYYTDDEIFVAASERPVIQTVMNVDQENIQELKPGAALIVDKACHISEQQILPTLDNQRCSFERIYFSRGSDKDIYQERKSLGEALAQRVLEAVNYDIDHTVLSFIPNTAEVAYMGLVEGINKYLQKLKFQEIKKLSPTTLDFDTKLKAIISRGIRTEKIAIKDIKLRTFITEGKSRNDLAAHVYDVTYGQVTPHVDNLIVIDDSIVRGTTLKQSIIRIMDRLHPKKIVIVSSSPQVRFPDYYGIDMSRMAEFCAFRAAIELLKERKMEWRIDEVYLKSKKQQDAPKENIKNYVKEIYKPFTDDEISGKIAQMLTDKDIQTQVEIIYQTIEGLHSAIPNHPGDWYFSGDYPTPGGNKMVNQAFINWYEGHALKR